MKQEARNLARFRNPPRVQEPAVFPLPLPDPVDVAERLRGTKFARQILELADRFVHGELELFGQRLAVGPQIHWRRDYWSGKETGLDYFRRIPFLDFSRAGDHKVIWEMNRHQHLVTLCQAALMSGDKQYVEEVWRQMASWIEQNPFSRGINWASALEVALRSLSWLWVHHLTGGGMPRDFLKQLFLHGLYLENNLSLYYSPNTHLTGEAAALHALGNLFGQEQWKATGARVIDEQLERQVFGDGSYFEQTTYYHVYALDMFLFHGLFRPVGKLDKMAEYLNALLGPSGKLDCFGDDDGGRFFHPYGGRRGFGRGSVAAAAVYTGRTGLQFDREDLHEVASWWLGVTDGRGTSNWESRLFPDAGMAVMYNGGHQMTVDAGPFGAFPSGHSHADTLSFTLRSEDERILVDPGSYTYVADPAWRDCFRGTAMHNTVRIDGMDQAMPAGAFGWRDLPEVKVTRWSGSAIQGESRYRGFIHVRKIVWDEPGRVRIVDEISGPPGEHLLEQFWHAGETVTRIAGDAVRVGRNTVLHMSGDAEISAGWRSDVFGSKCETTVICLSRHGDLPARLESEIILSV